MTDDELTIIKGMIYGYKRIPISFLQRKYRISYNTAHRLVEPLLVEEGLMNPILPNQSDVFNWQHQGWQEIAKQRHLWQPWALCDAEPMIFCDEEVEEDKCWVKEQYDGRLAQYIAVFDDFMQAMEWVMEYAEMRELLLEKTREFLQGKGEFVPMQEQIAFKHSREMQFATMTMADYLTEKCRLTDRKTGQVYEFDDIEDLLIAGWRLD